MCKRAGRRSRAGGPALTTRHEKPAARKFWRTPFDHASKTTRPCRIYIDKDRCKGCGYCVEFCSRGALEMSSELSPRGYILAMVAHEENCLGCGLCEILCPEFGIHLDSTDHES